MASLLAGIAPLAIITPAHANPEGGQVSAGQATITSSERLVTIHQHTDRAVIDWRSFDIAPDETTRFVQPSSQAIALNRVKSGTASQIAGRLEANGNVIIVNPAGVFFTNTAKVDVGGLVASTADIGNDDFMAGSNHLNRAGQADARVVNQGEITAREAGLVGLVAPNVENSGVINAKLGRVALAGGDTATVDFYGDGLISVAVSEDVTRQLVNNTGTINAEGGTIQITAAAGRALVDNLVSAGGTLNAQTAGVKNGRVIIEAQKSRSAAPSRTEVSARINASGRSAGQHGGQVDVLGDSVKLTSTAQIDAAGAAGGGQVRVGGDYLGGNPDIQNAWRTEVDAGAAIGVDALENGDGGRAIIWADDVTLFRGTITARGGDLGGDGGFVEVSGKRYLLYRGFVDTRAPLGETGMLLLDPADIVIESGSGDGAADGTGTFAGGATPGTVAGGDAGPTTIYESELEGIAAATNISLTATNSITINNLADNNLNLAQNAGRTVTFNAGAGGITMADVNDTITTAGGAMTFISGGAASLGNLASNGGLITFNVGADSGVSGVISGTGTAVTKVTGTGALTLLGTNTYTGNTTLAAGTLNAGNANVFGTGTLILDGGILNNVGAGFTLANNVQLANSSTINGSGAITFSGSMTNTRVGDVTLTSNNTGGVILSDLFLSNSVTNRTVTIAANPGATVTVSGIIANGGTSTASLLTKTGAGTLILNNANTYGGNTTISTGALTVSNASAFGTGTVILNGGTLSASSALTITNAVSISATNSAIGGAQNLIFSGNWTNTQAGNPTLNITNTGTTTFNGNINLSNSATGRTVTFNASGGQININGTIANGGTGAGTFVKGGAAALALGGTHTLTGAFGLNGGTTTITSDTVFGTAAVSFNNGALSSNGGTRTLSNEIRMDGTGTITGTSAFVLTGLLLNNNGNRALSFNGSNGMTIGNINLSNNATARTLTLQGSGNMTVTGAIANGGGSTASNLTKGGTGTLIINNASTFGGTMTLSGGTLEGLNDASFGTGTFVFNNATLRNNGTARTYANAVRMDNTGTITGSGNITFTGTLLNNNGNRTLNNNGTGLLTLTNTVNLSQDTTNRTLTFSGTGNITVSGNIVNGGGSTASNVSKSGNGTLILSGTNTYAGTTTISAGTLRVATASNLGTGNINLNGGTLELRNDTATNFSRNVVVGGNTIIQSERATSGAGVTHTLGTLTDGTGGLTVNAGSNVASGTAGVTFGATSITANTTYTVGTNALLTLGPLGNGGTARSITKNGAGDLALAAAASWTVGGNSLIVNQGAVRQLVSDALGSSALASVTVNSTVAAATALFDLNGFNQSITTLTFGGTGGTATSTNNVSTGIGTLTLNGNVTYNNTGNPLVATLSGNLNLGGAVRTFTINDSTSTDPELVINAVIAGAGGISKAGAGALRLNGTNTFTGTTAVTAGTLILSGGSALDDAGSLTLSDVAGATLQLLSNETIGALSGGGTTGGNITLGSSTLTFGDATNTSYGGIISGTGGIIKQGTGVQTFTGVSTYTGATAINAGTLLLGAANILPDATAITVASGATLDLNSFSETIASLGATGAVAFGTGNTFTTSGAQTYTGAVTGGAVSLVSSGGGAITANNVLNDFTGDVSINTTGAVSLSDANALSFGTVSVLTLSGMALGGNLTLNNTITTTAASGTSLTLRASGNFINNAGAGALVTGGTARWLVYSTDPASDTLGGLTSGFRRFSCTYGGSCPTFPGTGNGFLYSITPLLTATPAALAVTYGNTANLASYAYTLSGYLGGDVADDSVTGSLTGSTTYTPGSDVGTYNIDYVSGALTSAMGYSFSYANNATAITVGARTVTATVQNKTITYGATTPTLSKDSSSDIVWGNLYSGDTSAAIASATFTYGGATPGNGDNVGNFTLGLSGITATNYVLGTVTAGTLQITPYVLSVTANAQSKTYGAADPALTYGFGTLQNGDTASVFTGGLTRAVGETVAGGPYAISQGTLSAGSNYTIGYTGANFTINSYVLSVTANAQSKTYGAADPALTYSFGTLQNGDTASVFTGGLTRAAGETVAGGPYAIGQGTLSAGSNYTISYTGANLTISPYLLTVTANAQSKTYGAADPVLTYGFNALQNGDTVSVFTGGLTRAAGETVAGGPYAISQGTLSAGSNYTISYTGANLTINPHTLTVTANALSKAYGAVDPTLTYGFSALQNGDTASIFAGGLTRAAGETVAGGPYAISQGTLSAGSNYTISYTGANLTISPYLLTVTANAQSKTYGAADPTLTYGFGTLQNGDTASVFSGGLTRAAGETVAGGPYAIGQGTLSAGSNYTISYTGANLTISPYLLTVTANAQSKTYGAADPTLTYGFGTLQNGDTASVFTGGLTRAAGETVAGGPYAIGQGTLSAGSNYTISYTGANLTINPHTLTVTANALSKTYGAADPVLTYGFSALQNGDTASVFTGALTRAAGETVAGGPYGISQGTLSAGSNYTVTFTGNSFTITPYLLSVIANSFTKLEGDVDPVLTFVHGTLQNGDTASVFTGSLSRDPGETVAGSPYAIIQGTLSAGSNYTISFTNGQLTILDPLVPPTPPPPIIPDTVVQEVQPGAPVITQRTEQVVFTRLGDLIVEIDNSLLLGDNPEAAGSLPANPTCDEGQENQSGC